MGFWSALGIIILITLILRVLRSKYVWVDFVIIGLLLTVTICAWIFRDIITAVITFFVFSIFAGIALSGERETKVHYAGKSFTLKCKNCGYDGVEILRRNEPYVTIKCKRCGAIRDGILRS